MPPRPCVATYQFLPDEFRLSATNIALIYEQLWQIEPFFRWIKQHLKIKTFLGTSKNAVMTQVWVAMPFADICSWRGSPLATHVKPTGLHTRMACSYSSQKAMSSAHGRGQLFLASYGMLLAVLAFTTVYKNTRNFEAQVGGQGGSSSSEFQDAGPVMIVICAGAKKSTVAKELCQQYLRRGGHQPYSEVIILYFESASEWNINNIAERVRKEITRIKNTKPYGDYTRIIVTYAGHGNTVNGKWKMYWGDNGCDNDIDDNRKNGKDGKDPLCHTDGNATNAGSYDNSRDEGVKINSPSVDGTNLLNAVHNILIILLMPGGHLVDSCNSGAVTSGPGACATSDSGRVGSTGVLTACGADETTLLGYFGFSYDLQAAWRACDLVDANSDGAVTFGEFVFWFNKVFEYRFAAGKGHPFAYPDETSTWPGCQNAPKFALAQEPTQPKKTFPKPTIGGTGNNFYDTVLFYCPRGLTRLLTGVGYGYDKDGYLVSLGRVIGYPTGNPKQESLNCGGRPAFPDRCEAWLLPSTNVTLTVKEILEKHQFKRWTESLVGRGGLMPCPVEDSTSTTVSFDLPLQGAECRAEIVSMDSSESFSSYSSTPSSSVSSSRISSSSSSQHSSSSFSSASLSSFRSSSSWSSSRSMSSFSSSTSSAFSSAVGGTTGGTTGGTGFGGTTGGSTGGTGFGGTTGGAGNTTSH